MRQEERVLQREIMTRLSTWAWPVIALPHPNGLYVPVHSPEEKRIVERIIRRMKDDGLLVPGAADLSLHWPNGSALVELKRPRSRDMFGYVSQAGRPNEKQKNLAERAAKLGIRHCYAHSWEELEENLKGWGVR